MTFKPMITRQKIAIIDWTHLIEDYLGNIGLTIDDFINNVSGGWLFGHIEALKLANFEPVFICFSATVDSIQRHIHQPTNTQIIILPTPKIYRWLRKRILNPYTVKVYEAVINTTRYNHFIYSFFLKLCPYLATPIRPLIAEFKKINIAYILCQEYEHARFDTCIFIGKLLKVPVYATFQGGNWQLSPFEKYIRPYTLSKARGLFIASSQEIERVTTAYKGIRERIYPVFNPIEKLPTISDSKLEARRKLLIPPHAKVVIWHGRVDFQRKGLDRLVDAWQHVNTPEAVLYIVGNGTDSMLLEKKIAKSEKKNIVWIRDFIQDRITLYTYLKAADMYVFLSRNEGFPAAPIEAMASGLSVVATQAPGVREILEPVTESGGILLPSEPDAVTISNFIDKMLESEPELLGKKAQQHAQNKFSMEAVAQQFATIFNK